MAVVYEKIVKEDLELGHGSGVVITNPAGGTLTGTKIGIHTLLGAAYLNAADFSGVDAGAKIAAAIAALPTTGGTVDARGLEGTQTWASDPFVGVTKPVRLSLGAATHSITASSTIPSNVTLEFSDAGKLAIGNGVTVTINGEILAGAQQIFALTGTGKAALAGSVSRGDAYAQWWGATGDGTTDDATAIQGALNSGIGRLYFPPGDYRVASALIVPRGITLIGAGTPGSTKVSHLSVVTKDFNGDLFTFDGSEGNNLGASGGVQRLLLRNNFGTTGTAYGTAIKFTGTTTALRSNWGFIYDVNIEEISGKGQWTWAIDLDGSVVGAPNGIRDFWISNTRTVSSTGATGAIRVKTAYNIYLTNVQADLAAGKFQVLGGSSSVRITSSGAAILDLQDASGIILIGGAYTTLTTTAGTSATSSGLVLSTTPTLLGSVAMNYYDGQTTKYVTKTVGLAGGNSHFSSEGTGVSIGTTDGQDAITQIARWSSGTPASIVHAGIDASGVPTDLYLRYRDATGTSQDGIVISSSGLGSVLPGTAGKSLGSPTYPWRIYTQVIATASLPAAGSTMNGAIIIEDAGAGDRNLIIYAGAQRFRIDGGTAF